LNVLYENFKKIQIITVKSVDRLNIHNKS
jgi:hypothetical protein